MASWGWPGTYASFPHILIAFILQQGRSIKVFVGVICGLASTKLKSKGTSTHLKRNTYFGLGCQNAQTYDPQIILRGHKATKVPLCFSGLKSAIEWDVDQVCKYSSRTRCTPLPPNFRQLPLGPPQLGNLNLLECSWGPGKVSPKVRQWSVLISSNEAASALNR